MTDRQIIDATLATLTYWHPKVGVRLASHIAAARMKRLMQRQGGAS